MDDELTKEYLRSSKRLSYMNPNENPETLLEKAAYVLKKQHHKRDQNMHFLLIDSLREFK
jgi:hypothetical protein